MATAMRIGETADLFSDSSRAASQSSDRSSGVDSTTVAPAIRSTPGTRISTTATRTTTTRTTSSELALSADDHAAGDHAGFSFEDLVRAYFDCRRTKRNSRSALTFEANLEHNLVELADELTAGAYRPGRSICFVVTRPKCREVWAAQFRDRIVHHLLYNRIAPRFEASFIVDSCACIRDRGTLYGARRLEHKVRSITENWRRPAFYLKCDVANFFVSIDKQLLAELLTPRIRETWWRALTELVLWHDPRIDVDVRGDPRRVERVPPHKRLINQSPRFGLPIGNLSSQFFANVYLNVLDRFVKHELRARHYVRYVDDFVLLHDSPQQLNAWRAAIEVFLPAKLGLQLNRSKTILQPLERGVDFVGQVIKPWRRTTRRSTFRTALSRTAAVASDELLESANSYFGLLRQASHSHHDRAVFANVVRRRGHSVDRTLTKAYHLPQSGRS